MPLPRHSTRGGAGLRKVGSAVSGLGESLTFSGNFSQLCWSSWAGQADNGWQCHCWNLTNRKLGLEFFKILGKNVGAMCIYCI